MIFKVQICYRYCRCKQITRPTPSPQACIKWANCRLDDDCGKSGSCNRPGYKKYSVSQFYIQVVYNPLLKCVNSKEKQVDLSFSEHLLRVFFSNFFGQKKIVLATPLKSFYKKNFELNFEFFFLPAKS